jgi:tetratricopeptide (TPR) repeat protein
MRLRLAAAFVLLVVGFMALFQLSPAPGEGSTEVGTPLGFFSFVLVAVFVGVLGTVIARQRRQTRKLAAANQLLGKGDLEGAERGFAPLAASPLDLTAAQAHLAMSTIAARRAELERALGHCDQAIGRLSRYASRVAASDILLPELHAQRAFVLAVLGRHDEASAELDPLASRFPAYPYLARATFRVRLAQLVAKGDLARAARLVDDSPDDLPLAARDETLRDAVRAAVRPEAAGPGEVERIKDELRTDASLHRWMRAVAPRVLDVLENADAASRRRFADDDAFDGTDEQAEQEASEALRPPSRRDAEA